MRKSSLSSGLLSAIVIIATASVVACGGNSSGATSPVPVAPTNGPTGMTIAATPSLMFGPDTLVVQSGTTVTFAFGSVAHNVFFSSPGAPANIAGDNANVNVARTFPTAGTYNYNCHIHPFMHGTIVVQ